MRTVKAKYSKLYYIGLSIICFVVMLSQYNKNNFSRKDWMRFSEFILMLRFTTM